MAAAALLPVALAGVAGGAYLNAKLKISNDLKFLRDFSRSQAHFGERVKKNQVSTFYQLENHAFNPKIKHEVFIICENQSWTFKQAYDIVLRYAGWLSGGYKVVSGEFVAVDFSNSAQYMFLVLAIWSLGAIPAFINFNLAGEPLIHSVRISTARLLVIDPEVAKRVLTDDTRAKFLSEKFRNDAFPLEIAILDTGLQSSLNYYKPYRAPDAVRENITGKSTAGLMYTSGTTGLPKAAVIPWSRYGNAAIFAAYTMNFRSVDQKNADIFYTCMPLYHTTAFTLGFLPCLASATTIVIGRKFSASKFWVEAKSHKVTIIQYVGETLRYLLAAPPSPQDRDHNVRLAFGNGLRPEVWGKFKARFGIESVLEIYGATESIGASWNMNRNAHSDGAIGSLGAIATFMATKTQAIVKVNWELEEPWRDPETGLCQKVPRGDVGELLYALDPAAMDERYRGYLNNKKASSDKILRNVLRQGDAYFRTGDVVRFDSEGRLWFSDRIGDTFRWRSENVSTAEVGTVMGHHKDVVEANVYGVSVPGHEGRAGCAALLLRDTAITRTEREIKVDPETLSSLATYATNSLPKYAVPVFLRIVRDMAVTGNNKSQKTQLRNQGIDPELIKQAGSSDKLYWLRTGGSSYEEFNSSDLAALRSAKVRL